MPTSPDIERLKQIKLVKAQAPSKVSVNRLIDHAPGGTSRNFNREEWANSYLSRFANDVQQKISLH